MAQREFPHMTFPVTVSLTQQEFAFLLLQSEKSVVNGLRELNERNLPDRATAIAVAHLVELNQGLRAKLGELIPLEDREG